MNLGSDLGFNGKQAKGLVVELLGTDPGSPYNGQLWINTSGGNGNWVMKFNDNGTIRAMTHLAQVTGLRLDQFAAPNQSLALNAQKIINLLDPTSAQDAVTKAYVDSLVSGKDWKDSVRMATTGNITLSGIQTIDGISGAADDRVGVINQTNGTQNGIYLMKSGAWVRATDADTSAKVTANMTFFVEEGTANADKQFQVSTNGPITLGTTALSFMVIGTGTTYTSGNGITISGNVISIDTSVTVRKFSQDIGDGTSTSFTLTHNFNSVDAIASCRLKSTGAQELIDNVSTANTTVFTFGTAPAANSYRATVHI